MAAQMKKVIYYTEDGSLYEDEDELLQDVEADTVVGKYILESEGTVKRAYTPKAKK